MSDAKGKGREDASQQNGHSFANETDQGSQTSNSMVTRVLASATGLARSAVAEPTKSEINDGRLAAISSSGKSSASSGPRSLAWAESSRASQIRIPTDQQHNHANGIRGQHTDQHVSNAEAEFSSFLDGIDQFMPSAGYIAEPQVISDNDRPHDLLNTEINAADQRGYQSVVEQENHDGDDVLALLSDPRALAESFDINPAEEEIVNWNLTPEQVSMLQAVAKELLPQVERHATPSMSHPLNLIPDYTALTQAPITDHYMNTNPTMLEPEFRRLVVDSWEGVLSRYSDEVWGDLLPIVKEAREEIVAIKNSPDQNTNQSPKALRRLELVLGHLRST